MPSHYIKIINLHKSYDSAAKGAALPVLAGINLDVEQGDSIAFTGPSGSGKSTLLNIIGTLDKPTSGKILFQGRNLSKMKENELANLRNRQIGFVFQAHHLLPQCTVMENVMIPTITLPLAEKKQAFERAKRLLRRTGLERRSAHKPGQLSGGECQRVAVVRALVNQPQLLLADEPTGALDRTAANEISTLLSELNREMGVTLIMVSHSMEMARRLRRLYEIRDGKIWSLRDD